MNPQPDGAERYSFPRPSAADVARVAIDREYLPRGEAYYRAKLEEVLLPYWRNLAPVYVAALSGAATDDWLLTATVEEWPDRLVAQQVALTALFERSKLRQAWRSLARWTLDQQTLYSEGQRAVLRALEKEAGEGSRPLRELPVYSGWSRISCQQVLCLPLSQWEALHSRGARSEPASVDSGIVDALATRLATVFNAPYQPREAEGLPKEPVIWGASMMNLTNATDNHGMWDRVEDLYGRPHDPQQKEKPSWRYDGVCGHLRVEGLGEEPWIVTVMAPSHFLRWLVRLAGKQDEPTP